MTVKWTQGGTDKSAEIEPRDTEPERMSFAFPDALVNVPGGTELTFVFEIGGASVEKTTTLIDE